MIDKITEYLSNGGYFNPELMEHDKVRDLLMDVREQLAVYAKAIMDKDAEIKKLTRMLNEAIDAHLTVEIENSRLRDMLITVC
jgi:hypothetical protein